MTIWRWGRRRRGVVVMAILHFLDTLKDSVKNKMKEQQHYNKNEARTSRLKLEILQLEEKLQEQLVVRDALEKAMISDALINEIVNLEQYLMPLYRKAFDVDDQPPAIAKNEISQSALTTLQRPDQEYCLAADAARASQPLIPDIQKDSGNVVMSLAEHLGSRISDDHFPKRPNELAEDLIKCVAAIYCKLADPPNLAHYNYNTTHLSTCNSQFHVDDEDQFSRTMVEVVCLYRDGRKLGDVRHLLQNLKTLICRLEETNLSRLSHEEKLAFWINIHNALLMHAYLAYGVPQNNVSKRLFLRLKAAYNIGGHKISAETIRNSILGCRMSHPQWLRLLLVSKTKFKSRDERQAYAIENPQPLLHFALCSGIHSDPAIRVYTPEKVYQELENAKEEYIRENFGVRIDHKVLLPKIVESFAKDTGLHSTGVVLEMVQHCLPESFRECIEKCQGKSIEWIPHNFSFRYVISEELIVIS